MMNIDGREHLEVQFTDLPQSASIYKMEKPARVVMDFYGTYAEKDSIYILDNPHIKSIAVKHQDLISPYAGITVFLRNNASFAYQQVGNSIIVDVFSRKLLTKKNVMMLVGAGAVLAGGTATGILLGGQKEKPGDKKKDDLGLPPGFPGE